MRAIDTNLLVRLVVRDDERQTKAAEEFVEKGAWVPAIVLVETIWVLESVYERTASQLATAIEMLLAHSELTIQDADAVSAALRHFQEQSGLQFSDCFILESARKAGHLPLGTFDRRLAKLEGTHRL
jgi:predicted nucleic-acid-binding protein